MSDPPPDATPDATHERTWFSRAAYMRAFHVSDSTLDRRIKAGKLEYRQEGRRVFVRPRDEATAEDPLEAIMKALVRLAEQNSELKEEIALLRADIAQRGIQRVHEALPASTVEAAPVVPPEPPRVDTPKGWLPRLLSKLSGS